MELFLSRLSRFSRSSEPWRFLTNRGATRRRVLIKLTQDVEHLGKKDDVVYVQPGHMRQDLYPSKKATYALATEQPTARTRPPRVIHTASNEELIHSQLDQVVERLTKKVLEIRLPSREGQDKTSPLTTEMLSTFIKQKMKIEISPTLLSLTEPITEGGNYQIPLNFIHNNRQDLAIQLKVLEEEIE